MAGRLGIIVYLLVLASFCIAIWHPGGWRPLRLVGNRLVADRLWKSGGRLSDEFKRRPGGVTGAGLVCSPA